MKAIVKKGKAIIVFRSTYGPGDELTSDLWEKDGQKELIYLAEKGYCELLEEPKAEEPKAEEPKAEEPKITLDEIEKMDRKGIMNLCQAYGIKCGNVKTKDLIKKLEKVI